MSYLNAIILHNDRYLFSNAIKLLLYLRLSATNGHLRQIRSGWRGQEVRAHVYFWLQVNSRCGNCIPTVNSGYLALFFNRGGMEIYLFGLQMLLKFHVISSMTWVTFERMLSCSRPPMQGEQDEVPGKGILVRNRISHAVCRWLEQENIW